MVSGSGPESDEYHGQGYGGGSNGYGSYLLVRPPWSYSDGTSAFRMIRNFKQSRRMPSPRSTKVSG